MRSPLVRLLLVLLGLLAMCSSAHAQLRETEVLVLYDSRINDSVLVAEHYAGSAKVPGGLTGVAGARPRVLVLNLFTLPAVGAAGQAGFAAATADIDYSTFKQRLRDPLRVYLNSNSLQRRVRSIVLTKGLPHRITDQLNPTMGDNPGWVGSQICGGNETFSSVDAELAYLYQDLDAGEAGGKGDSKRDGWLGNPFWKATLPHAAWPRTYITTTPKAWGIPPENIGCGVSPANLGIWWTLTGPNQPFVPTSTSVGDLYMVCRLDGNTVNDVRGIINRAQTIVANTSTATFILDSDGRTFDGGHGIPSLDAGPDYDLTTQLLASDGRFDPANILFNIDPGVDNFYVGPNIAFAGGPIVVPSPVLLIASFGANHTGVTQPMSTTYANSFNYAPGAVFNTIESYNGRAYGGLGQNASVPQQQSADALAAGATFALGHVWEPFSLTVQDNWYIARNFFLGNLSWAEAAYTSMPALSWNQIVVGDPLARVRRDSEDRNTDGKLTIDDLYAWRSSPADLNHDAAADETDYQLLEAAVRGHESVGMKGDQR